MTNLAGLRTDLQTRFVDKDGRFLTDTDADRYLNVAYHEFCVKTEVCRREWAFGITANQYMYGTPKDLVKPGLMMWMQNSRRQLKFQPLSDLADMGALNLTSYGPPYYYTFHQGEADPSGAQIRLWPTPSSDSKTTTLTGNILSSASTIPVVSTTDFRDRGWIEIGSEKISYYSKSATSFLQCERGVGGTSATSHSATDVTTQQDVHMWYYFQPADLVGSGSPIIPNPYHDSLVIGALYRALLSDGRKEAAPVANEWNGALAYAKAEIQRQQKSNFTNIQVPGGYD